MFDKGAVTIKIKADTKPLATGLSAVLKDISSFAKSSKRYFEQVASSTKGVRDAFSSIGGAIKNLAGKAFDLGKTLTVGLVGAFTAVSAYGLKMGNSIQQTSIAFDTMLGDPDARRKLMQDITDFAKTTPFERFELIDASKQLLAMGVGAKDIIPTMQMLGDVSAGVSTSVQETAFVYGQVRAQGQAYTQDLNQFASRGIPIYEEIAKVLGVTVAQLRDGMGKSKIKVNFDTVNTAFANMTKEGGKFNNLMDKQSRSLGGIFSNVKDGIDNMILSFMGITSEGDVKSGSFFDLAQQKAAGFQEWLSANEETISQWGARTFGAIARSIDIAWSQVIAPVLRALQDWFNNGGKESIKVYYEAWKPLVQLFRYYGYQLWPVVKKAFQQLMEYMASEQFRNDLRTVASIIQSIADALYRTVDGLIAVYDNWKKTESAISKGLNHSSSTTKDFFASDFFASSTIGGLFAPVGRRANGGPVEGDNMYETGEFNRPEILDVKGKQYMIPGNDGRVMNQNQIKGETKTVKNVTINQYGTPQRIFTQSNYVFS